MSNLAVVTSTEDRLLDELKRQIAQGALRIKQLEKQVDTIPLLTVKVDELERERGKLANDLLDSQEVAQSMKQRLSLLHEQNNQLVKLAHSSGGGSSELLRNRNALVASLTQIKKLQERVDGIPSLKAQLRMLTEENTQLKERETELSKQFPDQLPPGVTRSTYQALLEENGRLTETNKKLSEEVRVAGEKLTSVSTNMENLKKRMDKFESTRSIVVPLQQRVKKLEKEKDELYQEYVEVKFHQQPAMDIDTAHLVNEVASLKKKNSNLQAKLEQTSMDARQEREKLVLKLFELETLNINSQKFDLQRRILDPEDHGEIVSSTSNHTSITGRDSMEDEMSGLPTESKVQLLKLQQLRVHSEQSRSMLQSLMGERDQLEGRVAELTKALEGREGRDLERSVEEKEQKLQLARERVAKLERELEIANGVTTETIEETNKELMKEVERLRENQSNYEELVATQSQAKQSLEERDSLQRALQKARDDKHKAERRYREGKTRLRTLAKELSSSVELIQKYQAQCMKLQEQLDRSEGDLRSVRSMSASYKAKLEVAEVVSSSKDDSVDEKDGGGVGVAYEKVCKERDGLKDTVESLGKTISDQQASLWKIKEEQKNAESANKELELKLSEANKKLEEATQQLSVARQQLEKERSSTEDIETELSALKSSHTKLETDHQQLSDRSSSLESELDKARVAITQLTTARDEQKNAESANKELELKLSEANKKLEEATQQLSVARQQLEKERSSTEGIETELSALKSSHTKLETDHQQLSDRSSSLESELDKARVTITQLTTARDELERVVRQLRAETESEHKSRSSTEAERARLFQEVEAAQESCGNLEKQLTEKDKCLDQEVSQRRQLEAELSEMRILVATLTSQLDAVSGEMETLSAKQRQGEEEARSLREALSAKSEKLSSVSSQEATQLQEVLKEKEKLEAELKKVHESMQNAHSLKMELEAAASHRDSEHRKALSAKVKEVKELQNTVTSLKDEIEGYKGTTKSLQRHVEEAESREMEHETLKQNFKQLEKALGTSSHDNKALFSILQQTLKELPSYSSEASRSLQDENLKLEEQVSVLSQWNDKQRNEIETLESTVEQLEIEKVQLVDELQVKASFEQENALLKRELKEVELEVGNLRRQARSDLQEEFKVKLETKSNLLTMFNQHNTSLQKQVTELTSHVHQLGGTLERDKPVSPPPMPDVALSIPRGEELRQQTVSDLERENYILKERIGTMEKELLNLQGVSSTFRRRSSSLRALFSVPVGTINEELQVK